ncbi:UNVERIFIED_CONTAM: Cation/H(+) antiporter 15 [Sesamum angustifolium]|uniref:Cation/H(+) antiporter 15 n=1 Tax=Sesamum angustifolium TaxID=2727405 RepID=A0AAW2MIT1_9LAMI
MITTNGIWQGDNPLDYSLPLFILQLTLVVVTTRILVFALKPLRQPRVISEILGGIILGPSVLGRSSKFAETVFPLRSVMVLETMANVGLLYFLFLVGVEMDIGVIKRTGKQARWFAFLLHQSTEFVKLSTFILFLGVALSVTAFPVLARILAELKLLNTEIGKIAMSSALINDMCAWVLLAFAIALAENEAMSLASIWVILSSGVFVVFCVYVVRPLISWMIRRTPEGESISEFSICLILTGVMISGSYSWLLMNTKGLVEMIVLNVGKDQKVLDDKSFAIMVIVAVVMTSIIGPLVTNIYKPGRKSVSYKRRTIQRTKPEGEFRIMVCVHTPRNVPTIINLLEASYPTKKSPICAYVLHLVELTGRASAMLIVHNTRKTGRPALNRTQAQSDHIINAFENFEQHAGFVSVNPLTAISPYSTMHEDICNVALDKRVAFIIVPFHKQQTVDGGMEATNPAFRTINQNVLANAPCSVGILVDRGLNGSTRLAGNQVAHHVALLFFGGPDDREALAYAWRMSEHQGTNLTVMRFLPGEHAFETTGSARRNPSSRREILSVETNDEKEQQLDEEYLNEFKSRTMNDSSIIYTERVVNHAGLTDWSECPELGAIGDLLASSDFAASYSLLVVQQYVGIEALVDPTPGTPDSPTHQQPEQLDLGNRRPPPAGHAHVFQPQP